MNTRGVRGPVRSLLSQLYADYMVGVALLSLLDALIVFIVVRILTSITSLENVLPMFLGVSSNLWFALLVGVLSFAWFAARRSGKYDVHSVESVIPNLREMLTTLRDTMDDDTEVVEEFRRDVINAAKKSSSEGLIPVGAITKRLGAVFLLIIIFGIIPLFSSVFSFLPSELPDIGLRGLLSETSNSDIPSLDLKSDTSIYGEASTIALGSETLSIEVDLSVGGGDLANPMAWQNQISDESVGGGRVRSVLDSPAIEELPQEYELAKAYNLKIRQLR